MKQHVWSGLNPLQVGRYAEYFVKMAFTKQGFQVYSAEIDDRGIDFVVRKDRGAFYEIQVKSIRQQGYIFCPKSKMPLVPERFLAAVIFQDGSEPSLFLGPSLAWKKPNALLVDRDYEDKKSKPEWGINLSRKNQLLLKSYEFSEAVARLAGPTDGGNLLLPTSDK